MGQVPISLEVLSGLTSTGQEELKGMLFNENEEGELQIKEDVNPDSVVSDLLKGKFKAINDERYKAADRKVRSDLESVLKKYGFDGQLRDNAELEAFIESMNSAAGSDGKPVDITPDLLEKNQTAKKWYQERFDQDAAKLREKLEEMQSALQQQQREYQLRELRQGAMQKALETLDSIRWDDGGEEYRAKRVQTIEKLIPFDRLKLENGQVVVTDSEGNPLRDDLQNQVTFESFIKEINPFGTLQYDKKNSPSPTTRQSDGKSSLRVTSEKEMNELLGKADQITDTRERIARRKEITDAFHRHRTESR